MHVESARDQLRHDMLDVAFFRVFLHHDDHDFSYSMADGGWPMADSSLVLLPSAICRLPSEASRSTRRDSSMMRSNKRRTADPSSGPADAPSTCSRSSAPPRGGAQAPLGIETVVIGAEEH